MDTFNDPVAALENYSNGTYDLLLIDIQMPKMNGFELYREIKRKGVTSKVCFFTAFELYYDEFKKVFPTLEVHCFIRKPIASADLVAHINSELAR